MLATKTKMDKKHITCFIVHYTALKLYTKRILTSTGKA